MFVVVVVAAVAVAAFVGDVCTADLLSRISQRRRPQNHIASTYFYSCSYLSIVKYILYNIHVMYMMNNQSSSLLCIYM